MFLMSQTIEASHLVAEADHPIGLIGLSLGPRASGGPRACQKKNEKKKQKKRKKDKTVTKEKNKEK